MSTRILIANRGEIARRINRTCLRLGMETVGVFDASDSRQPHCFETTIAVELPHRGEASPYLDQEAILAVAQQHQVTAIHPGYGFLSENAAFARRAREAGIVFVGPSAECIETLGDKDAARQLAGSLQIPTLEGKALRGQSTDEAQQEAATLGFPLMLKGTLSGGGRAMRKVVTPEHFSAALAEVQAEAKLFGSGDAIIAERFLIDAQHIEVQLCGFQDKTVIHLGERDCSAQRRYQKLIEEAPAAFISASLREKLYDAALQLGSAAGLEGLATAEFLCSGEEFFFLEVNPRLQVEHPVTELVTGLDLVALQLRTALDPQFALTQSEINFQGAAIEVRVVAEAPEQGFLPSSLPIHYFAFPESLARIEHALVEGDAPNLRYDSLLAKVCCSAPTNRAAREKAQLALRRTTLVGPSTTIPFLHNALYWPAAFTTTHLEANHDALVTSDRWSSLLEAAAAAALAADFFSSAATCPFASLPRFGRSAAASRPFLVDAEAQQLTAQPVAVMFRVVPGSEALALTTPAGAFRIALQAQRGSLLLLELEAQDQRDTAHVVFQAEDLQGAIVYLGGYSFRVRPQMAVREGTITAATQQRELLATLPGKVARLHVREGQTIAKGGPLVTVESMKMEHLLTADEDVKIAAVCVDGGAIVEKGQVLLRFE